jgi:hypothetical protein
MMIMYLINPYNIYWWYIWLTYHIYIWHIYIYDIYIYEIYIYISYIYIATSFWYLPQLFFKTFRSTFHCVSGTSTTPVSRWENAAHAAHSLGQHSGCDPRMSTDWLKGLGAVVSTTYGYTLW